MAALAGLSPAAVSRFLNGGLHLPEETARRIRAAVAELDYRPSPLGRRLSLGRSDTLGLVLPDIANPFFAALADAVQAEAEAQGQDLLLCATRNRLGRELDDLARLQRADADGVLFVTNHADDGTLATAIARHGQALVLLDEDVAGARVPKVFADNLAGGRLAAEHLLAAGHRRLALLGGPPGVMSAAERAAGFRSAVTAGGGAVVFEAAGDYLAAAGHAAGLRLLAMAEPPTAAFASSGETALGLLLAARERGVAVPGRLSVVAFDDVGPMGLMQPPLTAIRQPVAEMGRQGVALLLARLRGGPVPQAPLRLPVELIARGSVAPPGC
ncbi:LacI family transcriptional regulator [Roseomonas sp. OT10]|uniref:LacI family DNA-binding transcriptional regulator n=1 Tax=Roseomonas cutis TaxID=2897332 RepID=UPI001E61EFA2|nr:LacI family DNA-binding transcriptional regulator [Roseomonas sp. OT10]UFN49812.1 LacI family transcriptional regulator [Roseomonas sp. OT10]